MPTTSDLREWWGPPCTGPWVRLSLHGEGRITVRSTAAPAFRVLNTILVKHNYRTRRADTGAYNCFAAGTPIITRDGWVPIEDAVGPVTLLTADPGHGGPGRWVEAEVRAFGEHEVWDVVIERYGVRRTIRATPDHRWFVRREGGPITEVTTAELEVRDGRRGHRLASVHPQSVASRTTPSPEGIAAGLVFGDGTLDQQSARIDLCGDDNRALGQWFHPAHRRLDYDDRTTIRGLPRSWKDGSPIGEGVNYLYGWLAGYFAADGRLAPNGTPELNSADLWRLELARTVALRLGIASSPITHVKREGYGDEPTMLYGLRLDPRSLDSTFFLKPPHRERWNAKDRKRPPDWSVVEVHRSDMVEPTYCAVVPGTEAFAIDEFILTGNCRVITGGTRYSLHAYGIAADLNWSTNPYGPTLVTDMPIGMIEDIEALRTNSGERVFRWGGRYRNNKDAMHFEVFCSPADLATGITFGTPPTPTPTPTSEEDDMLKLVKGSGPAIYSTDFITKTHLSGPAMRAVQYVLALSGQDSNVNTVGDDFLSSIPTNIDMAAAVQMTVAAINAKIDSLDLDANVDTAVLTAVVSDALEEFTGASSAVIADGLARRLQE